MRKMNFVIKDETEERLRRAIADYVGLKKGNIRKAIEDAIHLWIDHAPEIDEGMVKQKSDGLKNNLKSASSQIYL